jgi:hypothetical protein
LHQIVATWFDGIKLAPFSSKECAHSARFAPGTAMLLWQAGFHYGTGHDVWRSKSQKTTQNPET